MADELTCRNCETEIKEDWQNCPKCGANLKLGKYSKKSDPLEKITDRVNRIDQFLTDKYGTDDNDKDKDKDKKGKKDGKSKTLFGD